MKRLLLILLPLLLILGGGLWWFLGRPPAVSVITATRGPAVEAVYATGTVEPKRWSALGSSELGRIVDYPATEGKAVAKGAALVRLDDETLRAELKAWEAQVVFLEKEVQRYAKLVAQDNVSRQTYERLQSDLDRAKAELNARQERIKDLTITAPYDAIVLRTEGEVGEVIKAGDPLVWIGQPAPFWITAEVDEEDIPRILPGQAVLITADAFPEVVFEGRVGEITPQGDPIDKQYRVRVLLPQDSPLLVGMTTEVNIIVRKDEEALLLPESAIAAGGVYIFADGKAQRRELQLGAYGREKVEVIGGLGEDEEVIDQPPADLADGAAVRRLSN